MSAVEFALWSARGQQQVLWYGLCKSVHLHLLANNENNNNCRLKQAQQFLGGTKCTKPQHPPPPPPSLGALIDRARALDTLAN